MPNPVFMFVVFPGACGPRSLPWEVDTLCTVFYIQDIKIRFRDAQAMEAMMSYVPSLFYLYLFIF